MASRDIRSTRERVNELRSIRDQIDLVIRGCNDVQKYYDRQVRNGGNNYEDIHYSVYEQMQNLDGVLEQAYNDLGLFRTNHGMTFQYQWKTGFCNLTSIDFTNATVHGNDMLNVDLSTLWTKGAADQLLSAGNIIKVESAEDSGNDGLHKIDSLTDQTLTLTSNVDTNNSADESVTITYYATASG